MTDKISESLLRAKNIFNIPGFIIALAQAQLPVYITSHLLGREVVGVGGGGKAI